MVKRLSPLSLLFVTLLTVGTSITLARDIPSGEISLVREPEKHYYLYKKEPAIMTCQARNADDIIFICMETQIPETSVEVEDVSDIDPKLIQAKIEVTRTDVQHYEDSGPFWCTCSAVTVDGQVAVTSRIGYVVISHLETKFSVQPSPTTATVGENVEFTCGAPEGQPKPKIMWRKNKKRLDVDSNSNLIITDLGNLVIKSVTKEDGGLYQCVARNIAGRRESESVLLTVIALEESAEPELVLSENDDASKKAPGNGKPRATRQSIQTFFSVEPQEKYYVTQDKPALIECGLVAADILTFRCNGKRMDRDRQTTNQDLDQAGNRNIHSQLRITYADLQAFQAEFGNSQTFQCICAAWFQDSASPNGWGRLDSNTAHGSVYLAYLDSTFESEPSDVTASINSDATMTCKSPNGEPRPWVYWYKDSSRLDPRSSNKYTVNAEGHLVIHSVQNEDAGTYKCVAENIVKSVHSREGRLTVTAVAPVTTTASHSNEEEVPSFPEIIPSTPVFLHDFKSENTIEKNGTKAMVCAVISAQQMTIDCGGKRLSPEEYDLKSIVHTETGKRLLHVKAVVSAEKVTQNPDNYFCQCTAWFLNEKNTWGRVISNKGYIKLASQSVYIGDQFVINPKDTEEYFEAEAEFVCKPPEGNPPPIVYWLKDGIRIDSLADPNFVILNEGTLFIEYVRLTDEGQYTCVAENEAGTRSAHPAQFTVLGKPEPTTLLRTDPEITTPVHARTTVYDFDATTFRLTQPIFSMEPNPENYIIRDQAVTLSCTVIAANTLLFVCNGEVLRETAVTSFNSTHTDIQQSILEKSLVITKEKIEAHTGSEPYSCVCRAHYQKDGADPNQLTFIESSPAVIQIAYLKNRFLQEPSDTRVSYLGRAELSCKAPNGNPEPEIHWLKDGFKISQNERIHIESSGSLIIDEFNEEDEGAYTCVAENVVRSRTSHTATVTLEDENVIEPEIKPTLDKVQPEPKKTSPAADVDQVHPSTPYISKDLHAVYSLVENKQVTISCEAYGVELITFTCGMQKVKDQEIKERIDAQVLPSGNVKMVKVIEASINVTKNEVENVGPGKEYWCQCYAHYHVPGTEEYQELISTKGVLEIASKDVILTDGKDTEKNVVEEETGSSVDGDSSRDSVNITYEGEEREIIPEVSEERAQLAGDNKFDEPKTNLGGEEKEETNSEVPKINIIEGEATFNEDGHNENNRGRNQDTIKNDDGDDNLVRKVETQDIYEDDTVNSSEKLNNEVSNCAHMLTDCSIHLSHNVQVVEFCAAVPEYIACMENYIKKCDGVISMDSMNAVKMAYMDTQRRCSLLPKCPELESCKRISSKSPSSGLTVQNFCSDGNNLLHCVDQALTVCNVTLSPLEEEVKANLFGVVRWFTSFCERMIYGSQSLASCDEMMTCDLYIGQMANDNTTSWCRLMSSLVECTSAAVNTCGLDELRNDLEQLHSQASYITCSEDQKHGDPGSEITSEGEAEPTGESKSTQVGETKVESVAGSDDGNDNDISNEIVEGGAEGKTKTDDVGLGNAGFEINDNNEKDDDNKFENEITVTESYEETKQYGGYDQVSNENEFIQNEDKNDSTKKKNVDLFVENEKNTATDDEGDHDNEQIYKNLAEKSDNQKKDGDYRETEASVAEASKDSSNNGSTKLGTSLLLATIMQFLTMLMLLLR